MSDTVPCPWVDRAYEVTEALHEADISLSNVTVEFREREKGGRPAGFSFHFEQRTVGEDE